METTISISSETAAMQVFVAALAIIVFLAFSGGWVRFLQQRLEVFSLSGKLSIQNQARLEKLAEMLTIDNAFSAYNQGVLWNLIQTVESHLKPLRKLGQQ